VTRDFTLSELTDDAVVIRKAATECLRRVELDQRIRLLGVRISTLEKKDRRNRRCHARRTCLKGRDSGKVAAVLNDYADFRE
jgi:chloramphenicol 3-O-phosphotransferase